jgi:hypothetical protein
MLLEVQEGIGASSALGEAAINQTVKSADYADGELVQLDGKDIQGLREVTLSWPGVLPKDDIEFARLEMEKMSQGLQSIYTTLEKLGEDYPDDEIARIRRENQDPNLRGEKVAEQLRAETPLIKQQMDQDFQSQMAQQQGMGQQGMDPAMAPPDETADMQPEEADLLTKLRALQAGAQMNTQGDEPVLEAAPPIGMAA